MTCIEVLSPTNKRGPGREEYAGKRFQVLSGAAHLVEIAQSEAVIDGQTGLKIS